MMECGEEDKKNINWDLAYLNGSLNLYSAHTLLDE